MTGPNDFTFEYGLLSRRTRRAVDLGDDNEIWTTYDYRRDGRLDTLVAGRNANTIYSVKIGYDERLNPAAWNIHGDTVCTFEHDPQGQLTLFGFGDYGANYHYDAANNRTNDLLHDSVTHNAANRLMAAFAGQTQHQFQHDADGNVTTEHIASDTLHDYTYDALGRLIRHENLAAGDTIEYSYDALDRRMEIRVMNGATTTTTRFVYDGSGVVLDLDGQDNVLAEYVHGPGTDEILKITRGNDTGYYIQDHMGSVVRIIDAGGTVLNSYRYLAWGEVFGTPTETIENRYGYTGRELNPDGRTMHYRAREYMPHLGRFLQEDPAGFVDGVNLYRYVGNHPCGARDPSGRSWCGIGIPEDVCGLWYGVLK